MKLLVFYLLQWVGNSKTNVINQHASTLVKCLVHSRIQYILICAVFDFSYILNKFYFFSKLDDLKVQISVLDKKSLKQRIFTRAF